MPKLSSISKVLAVLALFATCVCGRSQTSQTGQGTYTLQGKAPQDIYAVYPAMTATGNTANLSMVGVPLKPGGTNPGVAALYVPKFGAVQAFVTGSPATCTYHVYGTLKLPSDNPAYPADYQDLSGALDCTTALGQMVFLAYKPATGIVIALTALTGGTSPSVAFRYIGVH